MAQDEPKKDDSGDPKAGWLVLRVKPGEGIIIGNAVEIRLATINNRTIGDVKMAIKAPRDIQIRRVK